MNSGQGFSTVKPHPTSPKWHNIMTDALRFDKIKAFLEIFLVLIEIVSTKIIFEWEEGKNRMAKCRLSKAM